MTAVVLALLGCGESLWVDELHTSWTLASGTDQLSARAHLGNQTPLYFLILWPLTETLGQAEWVLRLPSVLCWAAAALVSVRIASGFRDRIAWQTLLAVSAWILLDRIQLFFATEARVYAMLQLVNLLGWWAVLQTARRSHDPRAGRAYLWPMGWILLSLLAVHLHLMGALAVGWQWATLALWLAWNREFMRLGWWLLSILPVLLGILPVSMQAANVWQQREQWESFAGDASLSSAMYLFPILPLLVPVLVVRMVEAFVDRRTGHGQRVSIDRMIWWIAAAGPWLTAWLVTVVGVAPVLHRRYILCSALPLVLVTVSEWLQIRRPSLRGAALACSLLWLVVSQGTWQNWTQGQLIGWQRGEDWRSAVGWIALRADEGDQLWCASGLIEARRVQLPLAEEMDQYLTFPLRGLYRVQPSGRPIEPRALVGGPDQWLAQWHSTGNPVPSQLFIVFRARATSIQSRLDRLVLQAQAAGHVIVRDDPLMEFGSVCIARLIIESW